MKAGGDDTRPNGRKSRPKADSGVGVIGRGSALLEKTGRTGRSSPKRRLDKTLNIHEGLCLL